MFGKQRKLKIDRASAISSDDQISVLDCHCSNEAAVQEAHILQHDALPDFCHLQLKGQQIRWNQYVQQMSFISGMMLSSPL